MNSLKLGITLGVCNARGLKRRLHTVDQLASDITVLGICETWIEGSADPLTQALDGSKKAPAAERLNRGHGGVGIIIHPHLPYKTKSRLFTGTIQTLTLVIAATTISVMYISPKATSQNELTAVSRLQRISGPHAAIMRDLNARHTKWDNQCNPRGLRIVKWAAKK